MRAGGGGGRERFFVDGWSVRDWIGGNALLMWVISLRDELEKACAKEGRDWGMDMRRSRRRRRRRRRKKKKKKTIGNGTERVRNNQLQYYPDFVSRSFHRQVSARPRGVSLPRNQVKKRSNANEKLAIQINASIRSVHSFPAFSMNPFFHKMESSIVVHTYIHTYHVAIPRPLRSQRNDGQPPQYNNQDLPLFFRRAVNTVIARLPSPSPASTPSLRPSSGLLTLTDP